MNEIPINANIYAHIFSAHVRLIVEAQMEAAATDIFNRCVKVCTEMDVNITKDVYSTAAPY